MAIQYEPCYGLCLIEAECNSTILILLEKHWIRGWCNSTCLAAESNTHAKCFTDAIKAHAVLRWGQSFNDPVHIDDYLNGKNPSKWDELFQSNQKC